jgi:hypothetical protein
VLAFVDVFGDRQLNVLPEKIREDKKDSHKNDSLKEGTVVLFPGGSVEVTGALEKGLEIGRTHHSHNQLISDQSPQE